MNLKANDIVYSSLESNPPPSPISGQSNVNGATARRLLSHSDSVNHAASESSPKVSPYGTLKSVEPSPECSKKTFADALDLNSVHEALDVLHDPMKNIALEMKGALLATGLAACCYMLSWFQAVLVPFFLAIFLMYLVDPLVEVIDVSPRYFLCFCTQRGRLVRRTSRGCSRAFASLCAVTILCIFFGFLGYITVLSVYALDMASYQVGYNALVGKVEHFSNRIGVPVNITTTLHDNLEKIARVFLTETMDILSFIFVTIIYLTYFLCTRTRASDAGGVWSKIDRDIQRFVTLKCFLSLSVALLVTIVYVSLNVGLAILWGILTFLLNWIPNVGAMLASIIPVIIIIITPSFLMTTMEKILAIFIPMSLHTFIGNFIEPKVFGKKLEMDPVIVILSLSAWGLLWGVVGMMLSVPLTAAFKIMLGHLKIWPELVAVMEGRYFVKYGMKHTENRSQGDSDDFLSMNVQANEPHGM